jgi:hypothetical protein
MNKSIYAKMFDENKALLHDNIILFIQECLIFYKYFLSFNSFCQHLQLPLLILRRCMKTIYHLLKAMVLLIPGLFLDPIEGLGYLSAGVFLEISSLALSLINIAVAILSLPVRLTHNMRRLTTSKSDHIDDYSLESIMYARLRA